MLEDKLLIRKYNRGETEVLRPIYHKYKDYMMTVASALLYDRNSAEDAVHEVFIGFIKSCGQLWIRENLKGYLATCVANCARNVNKADQRQRGSAVEEAEPIVSSANRPERAVMDNERTKRLGQALSELSYEQREVVVLHVYSGLKFKDIAKVQGDSINTVQGRYRYGINKLRSLLNSEVEK